MKAEKLAGLEPEGVFAYFEQLCAIPHGSGNTKAISDYLVRFAREQGLRYLQDAHNNVILFQAGTAGYEDHPPVLLQGHMDMVCARDADCPLDMTAQGLDVTHDETCVYANGTSLGGDDGIAVAYILALLSDRSIPHPPIEAVITVDEEIGMLGAAAIDLSMLKGRRLLNLDSEDEGIFTVACAGGARVDISMAPERRAVYGPCVRLTVEGLRGGHSGVEIDKNRANAIKAMGEFLRRVRELMPVCLTALSGGAQDNAIPYSCQATLVGMGIGLERINGVAEALQREIREKYDEPGAIVRGDDVDALGGNALTTGDSDRIIELLCELPCGVQAMSEDIPGLVQTSLNLGIVRLKETLELTLSVRSSVNREKQALLAALSDLAKKYDCGYSQRGEYPAWEYRSDSVVRDTAVEAYRRLFGKEPKVVAIHAGLECGILSEKLPGLDSVSMGPQMHDIHTSREKLEIASTARVWRLMLEILKAL